MPLYEYECANDGRFELVRKFSDPPLTACPKCGGPIEKLASAPAIQFKGTGWYVTDYARKGESGKEKRDSGKEKPASEKSASAGKDSASTSSSSTPAGSGTTATSSEKK